MKFAVFWNIKQEKVMIFLDISYVSSFRSSRDHKYTHTPIHTPTHTIKHTHEEKLKCAAKSCLENLAAWVCLTLMDIEYMWISNSVKIMLLTRKSCIGQFIHPVGGKGMG